MIAFSGVFSSANRLICVWRNIWLVMRLSPILIFRNSRARYEQTRGNMMTFEELTPVKGLTLRAQQAYEGFIVKYRSEDDPWLDYNT